MALNSWLTKMHDLHASDLYLTAWAHPSIKAHGHLQPISQERLSPQMTQKIANEIMDPQQRQEFSQTLEMNLALSHPELGRFRVNLFKQKGEVGMVIRHIESSIPSLDTLGLPKILNTLALEKRGLILFVGATGSGKSTSLASMMHHRNLNSSGHIITIEDPIEYVHTHQKCIITQREVGMDTHSYQEALKNTLRQAPDVILIGEIRTQETMEHAIAFAETGHLCLSTLHANNANQALDRIINFFPDSRKEQLLLDLSFNLKAIISQRLIPSCDHQRVVAVEILLGTPLVLDLIRRGDISQVKEVMEKSMNLGMQTFDMALEHLYRKGQITFEEALKNADSKNNLRLRMTLHEKSKTPCTKPPKPFQKKSDGLDGLQLMDE